MNFVSSSFGEYWSPVSSSYSDISSAYRSISSSRALNSSISRSVRA